MTATHDPKSGIFLDGRPGPGRGRKGLRTTVAEGDQNGGRQARPATRRRTLARPESAHAPVVGMRA
ncbi:hypothetical protein MILUP08_46583 [Micromonospora lupini str. Lupac 08]|uniref:Uncharacterized protein n=1 Tax=Micromonospora lupini str. Lupac 08 TaxID=1150864 RepID=I0LCY7_9ACTN|nr:hypothetical protein MILUP08_46583 [Micromonospora lupini str. Lupac 08]